MWAILLLNMLGPLDFPPIPGQDVYHAFLIGIDKYESKKVGKLRTCVSDVSTLGALLRERYGFAKVQLLTNEHATLNGILGSLNDLVAQSGDHQNLLLYFAGHGMIEGKDGFWLPHDADPDDPTTLLNTSIVIDKLNDLESKHVLLIVDSCYGGQIFDGYAGQHANPSYRELYANSSRWIITSGGKELVRDVGPRKKHSLFAYYLLKYLNENRAPGGNAYLTPARISSEVTRMMMSANSKQHPSCSPVFSDGSPGSFILWDRTWLTEDKKPYPPPWLVTEGEHLLTDLLPLKDRNVVLFHKHPKNEEFERTLKGLGANVKVVSDRRGRISRRIISHCGEIACETIVALKEHFKLSYTLKCDPNTRSYKDCGKTNEIMIFH